MITAHPAEQVFRGEIARLERQHSHNLEVIDGLVNANHRLRGEPMSTAPINGHGAVDLGAVRDREAHKQQLAAQLCIRAALICPCGERMRDPGVKYYWLAEENVPTPQGMQPAVKLCESAACSTTCEHAASLEGHAMARRDVDTGEVTWLDEQRADADGT